MWLLYMLHNISSYCYYIIAIKIICHIQDKFFIYSRCQMCLHSSLGLEVFISKFPEVILRCSQRREACLSLVLILFLYYPSSFPKASQLPVFTVLGPPRTLDERVFIKTIGTSNGVLEYT